MGCHPDRSRPVNFSMLWRRSRKSFVSYGHSPLSQSCMLRNVHEISYLKGMEDHRDDLVVIVAGLPP